MRLVISASGAAASNVRVDFSAYNTGSHTCTVNGYPRLTFEEHGLPTPVQIERGAGQAARDPGAHEVVLRAHHGAVFAVTFNQGCITHPSGDRATGVDVNTMHAYLPKNKQPLTGSVDFNICGARAHVTAFAPSHGALDE